MLPLRARVLTCAIGLVLVSCSRAEPGNSAAPDSVQMSSTHTSGSPGQAQATDPPVDECAPVDGAATRCDNLLPVGWRSLENGNSPPQQLLLAELADTLKSIASRLQNENDTQYRDVLRIGGCALADTFEVTYRAPEAMLHFPSGGTGQRDVVVGMFTPPTSGQARGCREKVFGHPNPEQAEGNGFTRIYQFIAVNAPAPDTGDGTMDRTIGKWSSWTLTSKPRPGNLRPLYRLRTLRGGERDWLWCSAKHEGKTVAYLTCSVQRSLMSAASSGKATTLDDAFSRYQRGDSTLVDDKGVRIRRALDDGAWGRCGNLGCCVSMESAAT